MKKFLLVVCISLLPITTHSTDFNQALRFVSEKVSCSLQALQHCDAMKVTTIFLGIGVATLLIDKVYPIFPVRTVYAKPSTGDSTLLRKMITQEIQQFSNDIFNPAVQGLGFRIERLSSSQGNVLAQHNPLNESLDTYQVQAKDVTETLNRVKKKLVKIRKKFNQFKTICLSMAAQQRNPHIFMTSPGDSSPRDSMDSTNSAEGFIFEEDDPTPRCNDDEENEKHPCIPPLKLNSSAHLHGNPSVPLSPLSPDVVSSNHMGS